MNCQVEFGVSVLESFEAVMNASGEAVVAEGHDTIAVSDYCANL